MCGIAAVFCERPRETLGQEMEVLLSAIAHRGPDGRGAIFGAGAAVSESPAPRTDWALGHVRLAIIDLSDAGLQPMHRAQDDLWITFNGEIYNYIELRTELQQYGISFETQTDTEVLLAAYRHWGPACVERFVGMFAFVIVDLQHRTVFAARDRLGIKPLYLWRSVDRTVVVSEPKQLLSQHDFTPKANRQLVVDYLTQGLLAHEPDQCCFDGVRQLPAGSHLSWTIGNSPDVAAACRYWHPSLETERMTWDTAVARTGDLFRDAVRLRLRSDVAVGTCLSGGVDSSSIVGVCQRELETQMKAFSICNEGTPMDESEFIDAVNAHCGSEPVRESVGVDQLVAEIDDFIFTQDEPVYSASQFAEYHLMRTVRDSGVTVLLNGQGGDEAMCGYRKFFYFYLKSCLRSGKLGSAVLHVVRGLLHGDRQLFQLWQGKRYLPKLRRRDTYDELLQPAWHAVRRNAWAERMRGKDSLREHQLADLLHWSIPVLLRYQDRNSMAFGIESRVPLVDHRFLEHCLIVPPEFFFRRGMTKRLLVDALGETLPARVRDRRTKLGFDTPQAVWMRGRLGELLASRVADSQPLAEIVHRAKAVQLFDDMQSGGKALDHFRLFRLACLAIWLERFGVDV